jgi:putative restriction endonuclease
MFDRIGDETVRNAAFEWLRVQVESHGDVLPRTLLAEGFTLQGVRVPLLGPQGIFKPQVLSDAPLYHHDRSQRTVDDASGPNDLLRYRYRGTDPDHPDNHRLRFTMQERLPFDLFPRRDSGQVRSLPGRCSSAAMIAAG